MSEIEVERDLSSPQYYNYLMILLRKRMESKDIRYRKRRTPSNVPSSNNYNSSRASPPLQTPIQDPYEYCALSFKIEKVDNKALKSSSFRTIKPQPPSPTNNIRSTSSSPIYHQQLQNNKFQKYKREEYNNPYYYNSDESDEIEVIF
ncbi:hypothetical protein PPL_04908 [Heterostelium album PN500]|uniref:Uncharacterized protein n=1 Tax=Heterostelium pallidum (strain ATCC 26659 / Pp 5 / PN500) TaxID=670386 RepID=D3B8W5_HETP5|nr:hypothetical protein PPL_04908 [Heterostelium album PN500]EFA82483.1 hypothetical protein PPL_04908 [Heterostelium album PN500]|eukprot:XP_020434600.1 hypothetical protein PPL_04908 [Heterostelium album PN500]